MYLIKIYIAVRLHVSIFYSLSGTGPLPMESSTPNNIKTSKDDVLVTSGECCACVCIIQH